MKIEIRNVVIPNVIHFLLDKSIFLEIFMLILTTIKNPIKVINPPKTQNDRYRGYCRIK